MVKAMVFSEFSINAKTSAYQVILSACNPCQPMKIQVADEICGMSTPEIVKYVGMDIPTQLTRYLDATVFPEYPQKSRENENPIKIEIHQITSDTAEFTGNKAVLYGYFSDDAGENLNFFVNTEQSEKKFHQGISGFEVHIDTSENTIILE